MWVGSSRHHGPLQLLRRGPGRQLLRQTTVRIGDYSTVVVDPTDGTTFWAANEYIGPDGNTDIWNTQITSFSLPAAGGQRLVLDQRRGRQLVDLQTYTPSDQGGRVRQHRVAGDRALRHLRQPGRHRHQARRRPQRVLVLQRPGHRPVPYPGLQRSRVPRASTSCRSRPRSSRRAASPARSSTTSTATAPSIRATRASPTGKSMSSTPTATSSPRS